jgi:hypothetical protein
MGFDENLTHSVASSDLRAVDEKIRDVELVACLSGVSHLGSDMMRAKDYDRGALRRAILILAAKYRRGSKISVAASQMLATTALLEVMHWQCRQCSGASEQIIGGVRQVCPTCEGSGIHRWGDKDRARACGVRPAAWHAWESAYLRVLAMARLADSWTMVDARRRLG